MAFIVCNRPETECFAEAAGRRGGRQRPCGSEFRGGVEDAADEQGKDEVTATIAVGAEDAVEANLACRADAAAT
jgi:hypothetical protein